jgi:phage tail tape-measure protein
MQEFLLQKLESQYSGSAEEMANTTQGTLAEMKNWYNDFSEFV